MESWEDHRKTELAQEYPGWDIWYVRAVVARHTTWCARPKGAPVAIFHASSPGELAGKLDAALAG